MKYISAQPATQYFGWQIDIMLYSFRTVGINLEDVHVLCLIQGQIDVYFDTLMKKYPGVLFSFYEDTRDYRVYIPSVKQHLLHKHYLAFPELENETVFLSFLSPWLIWTHAPFRVFIGALWVPHKSL